MWVRIRCTRTCTDMNDFDSVMRCRPDRANRSHRDIMETGRISCCCSSSVSIKIGSKSNVSGHFEGGFGRWTTLVSMDRTIYCVSAFCDLRHRNSRLILNKSLINSHSYFLRELQPHHQRFPHNLSNRCMLHLRRFCCIEYQRSR